MPTTLHEALVDLFNQRPSLAPELLRDVLGLPLPDHQSIAILDAKLPQQAPASFFADLVLVLEDAEPRLGIVVEVQLQHDVDKPFSWPAYAANLRARLRCPTLVLVVAPDPATARWARKVRVDCPGWQFAPLVLDPGSIPLITDPGEAAADPQLAVLSALVHASGEQPLAAARAARAALARVPVNAARVYWDLILTNLDPTARQLLEAEMDDTNYEFQSDYMKRHWALARQEGRVEGKAEGREEGKVEGREEGKAEGKAESILAFLQAKGLVPSPDQIARVRSCRDLAQLDRWLVRVATAQTASEVFADDAT